MKAWVAASRRKAATKHARRRCSFFLGGQVGRFPWESPQILQRQTFDEMKSPRGEDIGRWAKTRRCRNPDFLVYWNRLKVKYIQKVAVRTEYTPKMADTCSCKKPGASSKRWVSQPYEGILWYLVMLPYPECHRKGRRFLKEYAYPQVLHLAEPSACLLDLGIFWGGSFSWCISMSPSRCSLNMWLSFPLDLLDRVGWHFSVSQIKHFHRLSA